MKKAIFALGLVAAVFAALTFSCASSQKNMDRIGEAAVRVNNGDVYADGFSRHRKYQKDLASYKAYQIDDEINEQKCVTRGCIWNEVVSKLQIPSCFLNLTKIGYRLADSKAAGTTLSLSSSVELPLDLLGSSKASAPKFELLKNLKIKFTAITGSILRFQIVDPHNANRYQVPTQQSFPLLQAHSTVAKESLQYSVQIGPNSDHFGFTVTRNDNHQVMYVQHENVLF